MIKNGLLLLCAAGLVGCGAGAERVEPLQGVVELDERVLGFEVAGRVEAVTVRRGDRVAPQQLLARLESSLATSERAIRAAEAEAARAQVELIESGTRPSDIRAARARVAAAQAREDQLERNLERERTLAARGVSTRASVDDLNDALQATRAERRSLQEQVKSLSQGARKGERDVASSRALAANRVVELQDERLERFRLEAPMDATVLDVHVDPGEIVAGSAPVITLGDVTEPYADVFVPIGRLEGVAVGRRASVRVDSSSEEFSAVVDHVSRTTEFTPRYLFSERERPNLVVRVRLRISDPDQRLLAGVPAQVTLERPQP